MANESSENSTTRYCATDCKKEATDTLKPIYLASNISINIAGLAINTIISIIYQKNKHLRTKSNLIIVTIAIACITLAISEIACSVAHVVSPMQYPTEHWITVQKCIDTMLSCYCIQAMTVLSIQRCFIVSHIQKPNVYTNLSSMKFILFVIFTITAATSIPLMVTSKEMSLSVIFYISNHTTASKNKHLYYYWAIYMALFSFVPTFITIGSYSYIEHRIRRKSGALQKKIERDTHKRGMQRRADKQTSLGVIVILAFIVVFYLPKEAMAFLLITQKKLLPQQWLYFVTILMSNTFQQFVSLIHVCTSTRYMAKLRQSFTRTDLSTHLNGTGTMSNWRPLKVLQGTKPTKQSNLQIRRSHSTPLPRRSSKRFRSMQTLYEPTRNRNNMKDSFSVQFIAKKDIVISVFHQIQGKETEDIQLEQVATECKKHIKTTIGRRYTDSELEIKNRMCNFLKTNMTLYNCDDIMP